MGLDETQVREPDRDARDTGARDDRAWRAQDEPVRPPTERAEREKRGGVGRFLDFLGKVFSHRGGG